MTKSRLGWIFAGMLAMACSETAGVDPGPTVGHPTSPLCNGDGTMTSVRAPGGAQAGIATGSGGGFGSAFPPNVGPTVTQAVPPPAISGGTLRVLAGANVAVAADPDRDRVYVVDLTTRTLRFSVALLPGDEPGRVEGDPAGRAHVALRRGGALATIDTATGVIVARRAVCGAPRGVAYDPSSDLVHVACADGELVSLPAAGGPAVRSLTLVRDLRDVVVDGPRLRVSRFRSGEVLTVGADGSVAGLSRLRTFRSQLVRQNQEYTSGVAWRMAALPEGGVIMLHQRGLAEEIEPVAGGYGGFDPCGNIVHPAVTTIAPDGAMKSGPALAGLTLAVDLALSPDGRRVAFLSAGNSTNTFAGDPAATPQLPQLMVSTVDAATDSSVGCRPDGMHGPCPGGGKMGPPLALLATGSEETSSDAAGAPLPPSSGTAGSTGTMTGSGAAGGGAFPTGCGVPDPTVPEVVGQPIAVAFEASGNLIVQSREPAVLSFAGGSVITLSGESRVDTGHLLFHANAGSGLACASCHAEGDDDGRTWNFTCQGSRRTQSLQVGLRGTEPFHWVGDMRDITHLMSEVFVGRMSGPTLNLEQSDALLTWLDTQPRPTRSSPRDPAAVERGRAIFNDHQQAACASCHSGPRLTNATTVDVGTGGEFQVPSLVGVGRRGPFMHDGCAKTLGDRFDPACGGGDRHGFVSNLTATQLSDLVTYLESL